MIKRISGFIAVLICGFMMVSCGKIKEINAGDLAAALNSGAGFAETLTELDAVGAERRLSLNDKDYESITAYIGTMAVCDEFAIIRTNDTKGVIKKLNNHIEQRRGIYQTYRPAELYKLENVFIDEYKGTVVMVVSGSKDTAKQIFENYLKK